MNTDIIYHKIDEAIKDASKSVEYADLGGIETVSIAEGHARDEAAMDQWESDHGFFDMDDFEHEYTPDYVICAYDKLLSVLVSAVRRVNGLKYHTHDWVVSDETDRCYCCICGADGDA